MERVVSNKANYLAKQGYEIVIITTDQKQRKNYFELDPNIRCIDLEINYEENNERGLLFKLRNYPYKLSQHRSRLEECLLRLRPDLTISLFDHDVGFLWKITDGSYKLLEIHFSRFKRIQFGKKGIWGLINKYRSKLDLKYVKKYKRFIVLTEEDKGYWGSLKNCVVIPNANSFQPIESSNLNQKTIVAVGRYDHQKQFEHLLEAWGKLFREFPDWNLKIYGKGKLNSYLNQCIDQWGLQRVTLYPPVFTIEQVYLNSAIVAMTSRYEGLPMALLEAQACGVPMVAYACKCGPKDIIKSGRNGFLVAEGDVQAFSVSLAQLMQDDSLRKAMGREAKKMSYRFSEHKVMKQWLNLFEELHK